MEEFNYKRLYGIYIVEMMYEQRTDSTIKTKTLKECDNYLKQRLIEDTYDVLNKLTYIYASNFTRLSVEEVFYIYENQSSLDTFFNLMLREPEDCLEMFTFGVDKLIDVNYCISMVKKTARCSADVDGDLYYRCLVVSTLIKLYLTNVGFLIAPSEAITANRVISVCCLVSDIVEVAVVKRCIVPVKVNKPILNLNLKQINYPSPTKAFDDYNCLRHEEEELKQKLEVLTNELGTTA